MMPCEQCESLYTQEHCPRYDIVTKDSGIQTNGSSPLFQYSFIYPEHVYRKQMAAQIISPMKNVLAGIIRLYCFYFFHIILHFLHWKRMIWPRTAEDFPLSILPRPSRDGGYVTAPVILPRELANEVYLSITSASGLT